MALVNINFTVLAHAYVLYARALQSRIRGGTFAAPVRPALKSGTAMRTTVKSGTAFAVPAGPSTPPLYRQYLLQPFAQIIMLCVIHLYHTVSVFGIPFRRYSSYLRIMFSKLICCIYKPNQIYNMNKNKRC